MDDLLEAQGFVVAQDRLWQMDMARRAAAGELAELLGPSVVEHDKLQRVIQIRPAAEHLTATMPEDQRHMFEAFAHGVNAFIAAHQDTLPAEFRLLGYKPRPWQPVDSWLVALNMVQRLDTLFPWKLDRERVQAKLAPNLAEQLYPVTTWRDHPPTQPIPDLTAPQQDIPEVPPDERQSSLEDLLRLREILKLGADPCDGCRPGSNEWAVSGAHTVSGKAMLSNDMHLEHSIPDIWHEEDLQAGSFHVAGLTVAGIPLIVAGHNEHIAWGFTTLNGDVQDVYVEKTNRQGEYWTGNGWRQPEHDRERIRVRFGQDVVLDVERTDHGPVITPLLPHEQRMLALKWTLYTTPIGGLPLQALDAASNWTEFRQAVSQWWGPTQNMAYADDQGHIGYQAVGLFPIRPAGLSGVPIVETGTAADSQHEWQGYRSVRPAADRAGPRERHRRHRQLAHYARRVSLPSGAQLGRALSQRTHMEVAVGPRQAHPGGHAYATDGHLLRGGPGIGSTLCLCHRPRERLGCKAARGRGPDAHLGWGDHARIRLRQRSWTQPSERCGRWFWSRSWAPIGSSTAGKPRTLCRKRWWRRPRRSGSLRDTRTGTT